MFSFTYCHAESRHGNEAVNQSDDSDEENKIPKSKKKPKKVTSHSKFSLFTEGLL